MTVVKETGCLCERSYDGYICKMHYKAGKGTMYDELAYNESYGRIQGDRELRYRKREENSARKRQTVGLSRKFAFKTQ